MSAQARAFTDHLHLPSVHVRDANGDGFDYEEDLFVHGRGKRRRVERIVCLAVVERGASVRIRQTTDTLCADELAALEEVLPILMEEGNVEAEANMQERAAEEFARQARITAGVEKACARCGCSETRACSGGCIWATATLCSRCV